MILDRDEAERHVTMHVQAFRHIVVGMKVLMANRHRPNERAKKDRAILGFSLQVLNSIGL